MGRAGTHNVSECATVLRMEQWDNTEMFDPIEQPQESLNVDEADVLSAVSVDANDIENDMVKLSAQLARFNYLLTQALRASLTAKMNLEIGEARMHLMHRASLEQLGHKTTEKLLESLVRDDPNYTILREALIVADVERERLRGITSAIMAKREMLVTIGNRINAELRADPVAAAVRGARRIGT